MSASPIAQEMEPFSQDFGLEPFAAALQPLIDAALQAHDQASYRKGTVLIPRLLVWFVLALTLRRDKNYAQVLNWLVSGFRWPGEHFPNQARLVSEGALSHARQQVDSAQSALAAAQAGVLAAREQLASNQALTDGSRIEQHPSVQLAAAKLREAHLATQRTSLLAPVDGYVAKRTVQLGQRVAAGAPLMSLIDLNKVWVEANFKEVQLRNIRIGQGVSLVADQYGKKVSYQGTVIGLGAGTGAAFSLLPAENATGNWIKVVQRVPVRIALDEKQLAQHPLRVGLSMAAEVDVADTSGKALMGSPKPLTLAPRQTAADEAADKDVRRVIAANLAKAAGPAQAAQTH